MDLDIVVRGGVDAALDGSCLLYVSADGGEGDGDVFEGLVKRGTRVAVEEGGELKPVPNIS